MKKLCRVVLAVLMACGGVGMAWQLPLPLPQSPVKEKPPLVRDLTGRVTDNAGTPLPDSIVYLTNTRTQAVKSFITGQDGSYRFPALSPNLDYEVYAQHKGHRSDTKTLSSFDGRIHAVINLKIDVK